MLSANPRQKKGESTMELDERKKKILKVIIQNYMETGEPVGSRTISKDPDLKLSSATIRNEMSDLEEMGYIIQPHTSAGRIPSDKGYRLYVDYLMQEKRPGSDGTSGTDGSAYRPAGKCAEAGGKDSGK